MEQQEPMVQDRVGEEDQLRQELLEKVAGLHEMPSGAYNIRANGELAGRNTTETVDIVSKADGTGIDVRIRPGTKQETVHIPVILSKTGYQELVYNDFYIGAGSDVTIIAGCGIHNNGDAVSRHDGIHRFFVEKGAVVRYVEKHYGEGDGRGQRVMNPGTEITIEEDGYMEMETTQIKGIDSTKRSTRAVLGPGASLVIRERLLTHGNQVAESLFDVELNGHGSSANVISRSVAKEQSNQIFISKIHGNAACAGHTECDAIIMGNAKISAIPEISANHPDAALIHEAAIGKIAGEQIIKLMTLGLTEAEAEEAIVAGFLK